MDSSQQIQDVKDQLEDLIPWAIKLRDSLTKAERRTQLEKLASHLLSCQARLILCRSLDDIEKRSQVLLEKGKTARFLDKVQDTQAVMIRLIDRLQKTILIYQMCAKSSKFWAGLTWETTDTVGIGVFSEAEYAGNMS